MFLLSSSCFGCGASNKIGSDTQLNKSSGDNLPSDRRTCVGTTSWACGKSEKTLFRKRTDALQRSRPRTCAHRWRQSSCRPAACVEQLRLVSATGGESWVGIAREPSLQRHNTPEPKVWDVCGSARWGPDTGERQRSQPHVLRFTCPHPHLFLSRRVTRRAIRRLWTSSRPTGVKVREEPPPFNEVSDSTPTNVTAPHRARERATAERGHHVKRRARKR